MRQPQEDEEGVERIVESRAERQGILARPKPPMLWFVIQVLPFSARQQPGIDGMLYLYERPSEPPVAYAECFGGARLINDSQEVSDLTTVMGMLRAAALPPWESLTLIRTIRRDHDRR